MYRLERTNAENADFVVLVKLLDAGLKETDGDEHDFYNQFNGLASIKHALVLYNDDKAVACGAFKVYDSDTVEIKRMYVAEEARGQGLSKKVLAALEEWASEIGYKSTVLETGKRQVAAIGLYESAGYNIIPNYGQYENMENSLCFEKNIK